MKRFFVRSAEGMWFYATPEEAKAEAERLLDVERYYAIREGGWGEDANQIMWGEIRGRVEERCVDASENDGWHVEMTLEDAK